VKSTDRHSLDAWLCRGVSPACCTLCLMAIKLCQKLRTRASQECDINLCCELTMLH
jgi:hypothetical protein